jgi:hypothetical protein
MLRSFGLAQFKEREKNEIGFFFQTRATFSLAVMKLTEIRVVEKYCWAMTRAVRRSCCDR